MSKVSIVIPFYNEEKGIAFLSERLSKTAELLEMNHKLELVLVDDGSSDQTSQLLRNNFPSANIVRHPKNLGIGAAMRTGFEAAEGDYFCFMDADCTYAPEELVPMLVFMKKNPQIDILVGSQYHPEGKVINVPGWRLILSQGASLLYRLAVRRDLFTYTGCFRIYRKNAARAIKFKNNGFLAMAEVLVRAVYMGLNIAEYPTALSSRLYGTSKIKTFKVIMEHLKFLLSLPRLKRELNAAKKI